MKNDIKFVRISDEKWEMIKAASISDDVPPWFRNMCKDIIERNKKPSKKDNIYISKTDQQDIWSPKLD